MITKSSSFADALMNALKSRTCQLAISRWRPNCELSWQGRLSNQVTTDRDQTNIETSAAIAELAGRVEQLERESEAKLSQIYERFDRIEHPIAAPTAAPLAGATESRASVARKRARGTRHDAFDPSQNSNAPGVPRPLGSRAD